MKKVIAILFTVAGEAEKIVLKAILCCVHRKLEDVEEKVHASFTVLPVMLVKGVVALTRPLCSWLQVRVFCPTTSQLHFLVF